ncbi:hypothetical protein LJC18_01555 [Lachnospiraceae bacterium OttesenSCG-928-E19]|nr:hypothetical protein [Lachnospiraceae bacterium OttesenSCG-928-E19]
MKLGKVTETIMNRSVIKQLPKKRIETSEEILLSDVSLYGEEEELGYYAIARGVNQILAQGGRPTEVSIQILLKPEAKEIFLKQVVRSITQCCRAWTLNIRNVEVQVSPAVNQMVIQASVIGREENNINHKGENAKDIVLTKWIGMEGTLRLLQRETKQLSNRFIPTFLQEIVQWRDMLNTKEEIEIGREAGVNVICPVAEGGIYAALWELAKIENTGFEISLGNISLRQETVEICEYFKLNPYELASAGCTLMLAEDGEALVSKMQDRGIRASVLGSMTQNRDKVIKRGEERRFLDRPAPDELIKMADR